MLVYEKKVSDARHLFGTVENNVPSSSDVQLTYKDADGQAITPTLNDTYFDKSANGVQRIVRKSDNKNVNVFIGDTLIIGEASTAKVAKVEPEEEAEVDE